MDLHNAERQDKGCVYDEKENDEVMDHSGDPSRKRLCAKKAACRLHDTKAYGEKKRRIYSQLEGYGQSCVESVA